MGTPGSAHTHVQFIPNPSHASILYRFTLKTYMNTKSMSVPNTLLDTVLEKVFKHMLNKLIWECEQNCINVKYAAKSFTIGRRLLNIREFTQARSHSNVALAQSISNDILACRPTFKGILLRNHTSLYVSINDTIISVCQCLDSDI